MILKTPLEKSKGVFYLSCVDFGANDFRVKIRFLFFILLFLFCVSCTSDLSEDSSDAPTVLFVSPNILVNDEITAPAGATVVVVNNDSVSHTVTSQSAQDAFDDTGDFDVEVVAGQAGSFTAPTAPSGAQFFFYCRNQEAALVPSNGVLTIE